MKNAGATVCERRCRFGAQTSDLFLYHCLLWAWGGGVSLHLSILSAGSLVTQPQGGMCVQSIPAPKQLPHCWNDSLSPANYPPVSVPTGPCLLAGVERLVGVALQPGTDSALAGVVWAQGGGAQVAASGAFQLEGSGWSSHESGRTEGSWAADLGTSALANLSVTAI